MEEWSGRHNNKYIFITTQSKFISFQTKIQENMKTRIVKTENKNIVSMFIANSKKTKKSIGQPQFI